jgi:hypothetical protein
MKKYVFELLAGILLVTSLLACKGVKPASGGGGGLVQVFVKGRDSLLCHAGPISYKRDQRGERFEIDHTYLKVKSHRNQVVCNFSVFTADATFNPEGLSIELSSRTIEVSTLTKFFAEGFGKKKYHYRYSFTVSDVEFRDWMLDAEPVLSMGGKKFTGGKSFRKDAGQVYRQILFDAF